MKTAEDYINEGLWSYTNEEGVKCFDDTLDNLVHLLNEYNRYVVEYLFSDIEALNRSIYEYPKGVAYKNISNGEVNISSGSFSVDSQGFVFDSISKTFVFMDGTYALKISYDEYKELAIK